MDIFISFEACTAEGELLCLALENDQEGLKKLKDALELGSRLFTDLANNYSGQVLYDLTTKGQVSIGSPENLPLSDLVSDYERLTSLPIYVGIGLDAKDSYIALEYAKKFGEDNVVFYEPEMETEIHDGEWDEDLMVGTFDDLEPEELTSLDQPYGKKRELIPDEPVYNRSEIEALGEEILSDGDLFEQEDRELVQLIADSLNQVKSNVDAIEALRGVDPSAYESILGIVQSLIGVSQILSSQSQSEAEEAQSVSDDVLPPPSSTIGNVDDASNDKVQSQETAVNSELKTTKLLKVNPIPKEDIKIPKTHKKDYKMYHRPTFRTWYSQER